MVYNEHQPLTHDCWRLLAESQNIKGLGILRCALAIVDAERLIKYKRQYAIR